MLLAFFAASSAFTTSFAQEAMALQVLVGADLIASESEACVPGDPVGNLVTFQIDESTLTNPAADIQEVQWVISRNGVPALASDYALDAAIGEDLADWSLQMTLSFAPLTDGLFEVSGDVVWATLSQNLEPAFLEVGAAPDAPIYTIPETAFCDLGGELDVASSVFTPNSLETELCATVVDLATGSALALPDVGCETSGADPNQVSNNFAVSTLNAGCYILELEASNRCGTTAAQVDIDVLGTPNFSLSLTPFCEADPDAIIVSDFDLTFANCDNDSPLLTETWTLEGDAVDVTTANEFPLPETLGYVNGDVVCQTIDLGYAIGGGDSVHCAAQACEDILFFEAAAIEWQVTYPVNYPPVCDGDSLAIELIDVPSFASHEWITTPLPDSTSSNEGTLAYCNGFSESNDEAYYFALDPPGISGTIRRTTCHQAPDFSTTTCVTDTTFEIDVAPKPSIAWVDSINSVTACAYETNSSLAIVIDSDNASPSPWTLTWVVTAEDGTVSEIVQTITPEEILNNASLSLTLEEVIASCFDGDADQITSFDVQVSALNESGCESQVLDGSMTLYAAPAPTAIFEAICKSECAAPINVNADGGLNFQWFLDADSCDGMDEIPADTDGDVCSTPFPWDLSGSGFNTASTDSDPVFCDVTCNSTVGMRLQQSWTLPTVEDSLLQCTSPVVRFELEVVPFPDLQIATEGALCDNLDEFTFTAFNCSDSTSQAGEEPCLDCPATSCESCFSQITNVTDWKYSINGGATFAPSFPAPALTGNSISVPTATLTSGFSPTLLRVVAHTSSPNYPALLCESIDTLSFEWYEAPVIPPGGLLLPDYLCPGSEYELDASALTQNGTPDELCFLWEDCTAEDSPLVWEITGDPCVNEDCGVSQGQGVLESMASISVPFDIEPCTDVCIDLTITDSAGCRVDTNFVLDVRALPSLEGISVMEAFGNAASVTLLNPPCASPAEDNTTPTECPGSEVLVGDTTNIFCANSNFLLSADGVQAGCEDPLDGGGAASPLSYVWEVYDVANDPALANNLVSMQDTCGYGKTPQLPCIPSYVDAPTTSLSVYLTINETNGCSAEFQWLDTLSVFPAPCIELTSSNQYCSNEDPELEICGPQSLAFCCDGSLEEPEANASGCFEFVLPQSCVSGGTNAGPFYGSNTYAIGNESITCTKRQIVTLVSYNPPQPTILGPLEIEDDSFDPMDATACEGGTFTMTALFQAQGNPPPTLTYEWFKNDDVTSTSLGGGQVISLTAELGDGADCEVVNVCSGEVIVTNSPATDLTCQNTASWEVFIRPTPAFEVTSEGMDFCDGDSVELCATRICGVADGATEEDSWDWGTTPACDESPNSIPTDNPCWSFEAAYEGDPGDGSSANSKSIALTDSYGCSHDTTFDYSIYELPDLGIEASHICEGENTAVEVNGADIYDYDFDPQESILTDPAIFAPGDAVTGDSIQQLELLTPDSGDVLVVTGTLVYPSLVDSVLGCSATDSIHMIVYPLPIIEPSLDPEAPYCEEDSVTFCDLNEDSDWVPPVYDYVTINGESELATLEDCFTFELLPPTTGLTVTKILNYEYDDILTTCESVLDTTITVVPKPDIGLTADAAICQQDSTAVVCAISNSVVGSAYTHTWYVNSGGQLSDVIVGIESSETSPFVASTTPQTDSDPEDIQVWCEVSDSVGCSSIDSIAIEVVATPILEWTTPLPDEVCSPSLACVEVGVTNELNPMPEIITLWANPNGGASDNCFLFQNNTPCPAVEDISATVQLVHVLAAGGTKVCESFIDDSLVVNPTPSPAFLLDAPQACFDTANAVCIEVLHDVQDYNICAEDAYTYTWFVTPEAGLNSDNISVDDANSPVPEICIDAPGSVELILEIENSYGCSQTTPAQPFTVRDLPDPTLTFTQPDGICMPTTVVINATSIGASDFIMSIEDYGTFENFSSPLVLPVEFPGYRNVDFEVSKTHTTPSILGYDNDGNPITENDVLVCSVETTYLAAFEGVIPPTAAFSVLPGNTIDLSNGPVQFVNESEGQTQNIWIFGDGDESGSSEVNPQHQYNATGEYLVELAVVDDRGCTDYAEDVIRVREDLFLYVPNAFTPARGGEGGFADNLNDSWFPSIEGTNVIESYEVCVFNRTGHRVWCSQDPDHPASEQWNGTGPEGTHLVQTGVYTWRITLKKKNGQGADVYTGHVSVIR